MTDNAIGSLFLIESSVNEDDRRFSDVVEQIVVDTYGRRPDWLEFSAGRRFGRSGILFRELFCIAGSVQLAIMQRARQKEGISRAIIYRANIEGGYHTFEIRGGIENEFPSAELTVWQSR